MIQKNLPLVEQEFLDSMNNYIKDYKFSNEEIVEELEKKIEEYTGSKHALCVNSATNAIFMCLSVFSSKKRDKNEIIIPNYGFPAASRVSFLLNLKLVPVDMEKEILSMNLQKVEKSINKKTLAVIHIESNGVVGNADKIKSICDEVFYIEDSAPSMIQRLNGVLAGTFGDVGIYSFSPTKPMCAGEGGVIITNNDETYKDLKTLRHSSYNETSTSLNFKLSPFLAAYLIPQVKMLEIVSETREKIHKEYKKYLEVFEQEGSTNRYGTIMYLSKNSKKIHEKLNKYGIDNRYKYYPLCYEDKYPVSKEIREEIIDLPLHHKLTPTQVKVISTIVKVCENE